MAYAYFRDNWVMCKDLTDIIVRYCGPSERPDLSLVFFQMLMPIHLRRRGWYGFDYMVRILGTELMMIKYQAWKWHADRRPALHQVVYYDEHHKWWGAHCILPSDKLGTHPGKYYFF